MNQAKTILLHAIEMIFLNFGATCRVLAPAFAIICGAAALMMAVTPDGMEDFARANAEQPIAPPNIGGMLLAILMMVVGFLIMAVLWHRYVLLSDDERAQGVMPGGGVILSYFGKSLLLGLLLMGVVLVVMVPVSTLAAANAANTIGFAIISLPAMALVGWVGLRLSLVLPAAAMSQRMGFGESWQATKPMSQEIIWLAVGLALFNIVLELVVGPVAAGLPTLATVLELFVSVVTALISTSVLTTLYGILIEGRRL